MHTHNANAIIYPITSEHLFQQKKAHGRNNHYAQQKRKKNGIEKEMEKEIMKKSMKRK